MTGRTPQQMLKSLTDRELETLRLIPWGWSNEEIARALFISVDAIKTRLRCIRRKTGLRSRMELAQLYVVHSLPTDIQPGELPGEKLAAWRKRAEAARQTLRDADLLSGQVLEVIRVYTNPQHFGKNDKQLAALLTTRDGQPMSVSNFKTYLRRVAEKFPCAEMKREWLATVVALAPLDDVSVSQESSG